MILFEIVEMLILACLPGSWAVGVIWGIRLVAIGFAIYNMIHMYEMYRITGDVSILQDMLIQISAICTLGLIRIGPMKDLFAETAALKGIIAEMKAKGVPARVTLNFLMAYGAGRANQATQTTVFFKNYGLTDNQLIDLSQSFDRATIIKIENAYMMSAIKYTPQDTEKILILFKQAGSPGVASSLSNSLITLSNYGITPSAFSAYGIIGIKGVSAAINALSMGITTQLLKQLADFGIKTVDYERYNITSQSKAEILAEALANGAKLLNYKPTSGAILITTPGKTTTILGRYVDDMQYIIRELELPKSYDFGEKPNGFNILNCPDDAYKTADQFWDEFNKPFLEQAVARGDEIIMATEPVGTALRNSDGTLTGFGREFEYLTKEAGYRYDSVLKKMIKN